MLAGLPNFVFQKHQDAFFENLVLVFEFLDAAIEIDHVRRDLIVEHVLRGRVGRARADLFLESLIDTAAP
jgi:hypothetical protein